MGTLGLSPGQPAGLEWLFVHCLPAEGPGPAELSARCKVSAMGKQCPQRAPHLCDSKSLWPRTAGILWVWGRQTLCHFLPGFLPTGLNWVSRTVPSWTQK